MSYKTRMSPFTSLRTHWIKNIAKGLIIGALASFLPIAAQAASYQFTWTGSNGYTLVGAFSIPDNLTQKSLVNQRSVECFWIKGQHEDSPVGQWSLGQLDEETHWLFNFEPTALQFRVGGYPKPNANQAWNMNGFGTGCGEGGFGFHAGNAAQDVCINNKLIRAS